LATLTSHPPPPKKLAGSASISGLVCGKSGVDMSTPVHPVATPLVIDDSTTFPGRMDFRVALTKVYQFLGRMLLEFASLYNISDNI